MASSSSSSSFSALNCIVFVLILLLSFDTIIVRAARPARPAAAGEEVDPMLKVCNRTTYPKTCTECITPVQVKPLPPTFDLKFMVGEILFCAWSHATYAYNDAEDLANNCTINGCSNKDVVLNCNSTIFDAKEQIFTTYDNTQTEDLSKIQTNLGEARTKLDNCAYLEFPGEFTEKMIYEMDKTKHLQEIATALCENKLIPDS